MGRVYALDPKEGERDGKGCRVFSSAGQRCRYPVRVEFERDADYGHATVEAFYCDEGGNILFDPTTNTACRITFHAWVQLSHLGEPDPLPYEVAENWEQVIEKLKVNGGFCVARIDSEEPHIVKGDS